MLLRSLKPIKLELKGTILSGFWSSDLWFLAQIAIKLTRTNSDKIDAGVRKRADSYFPPEDRVRLVRLVSHGELPGERSGESTSEIS